MPRTRDSTWLAWRSKNSMFTLLRPLLSGCLPALKTGRVPPSLWGLPCLRVVALQGNNYTGERVDVPVHDREDSWKIPYPRFGRLESHGDGKACSQADRSSRRRRDVPKLTKCTLGRRTSRILPITAALVRTVARVSPVTPPRTFRPAGCTGASAGDRDEKPATQRLGVAVSFLDFNRTGYQHPLESLPCCLPNPPSRRSTLSPLQPMPCVPAWFVSAKMFGGFVTATHSSPA